MPLGLLVHGNNHFIVSGPLPSRAETQALVHYWSLIQVGSTIPAELTRWRIVTSAFRENLEWAAVVTGEDEISPAVKQLLNEVAARGVFIQH